MYYTTTVEPPASFVTTFGKRANWQTSDVSMAGVYIVTVKAEAGCSFETISYTLTVSADIEIVECDGVTLTIDEDGSLFSPIIYNLYDEETVMNWDDTAVSYTASTTCGPVQFEIAMQNGDELDEAVFFYEFIPADNNSFIVYSIDPSVTGDHSFTIGAKFVDYPNQVGATKDFMVSIENACETSLTGVASSLPDSSYTVAREELLLSFDA